MLSTRHCVFSTCSISNQKSAGHAQLVQAKRHFPTSATTSEKQRVRDSGTAHLARSSCDRDMRLGAATSGRPVSTEWAMDSQGLPEAVLETGDELKIQKPTFAYDALEPHISKDTLESFLDFQQKTIDFINAKIRADPNALGGKELIEIQARDRRKRGDLFHSAGQVVAMDLFWETLNPDASPEAIKADKFRSNEFNLALKKAFGSFADFEKKFRATAQPDKEFGSGWAWLILDEEDAKLDLVVTERGDNPVAVDSSRPLIVCSTTYSESLFDLVDWAAADAMYKNAVWGMMNRAEAHSCD